MEREAAILQAAITIGLAVLFGLLHRRYRRPHFLWWSGAWLLYTVRVALIIVFLGTAGQRWLYLHQVATGWTAIAILGAALSFERRHYFRPAYAVAALFPVAWAYVTIFVLDNFLLAASLTVVLMSAATIWTGLVFLRFRRRTGSASAGFLAGVLLLWGLHHLDYPLLRAQGLLAPWSYYIDIVLILSLAVGVLLLVMEELRRGLRTLSSLSGDLHRVRGADGGAPRLLERALGLAGVTGSSLWHPDPAPGGNFSHGIGACAGWRGGAARGPLAEGMRQALESRRPILLGDGEISGPDGRIERAPFAGLVPVIRDDTARSVAVITGPGRAPFTALDEDFLLALGQQIGAALERADLDRRLADRTAELERLSVKLIHQHEDQRRRLARELHDETAQVFSAMKLQLGLLGESAGPGGQDRIGRMADLVDAGIDSIRSVADDLRPPLLDDLGLAAALQALAADFRERCAIPIRFERLGPVPPADDVAELALFRTLQEALANVARHAEAGTVEVTVAGDDGGVVLTVDDDGRGFHPDGDNGGRMGLVGMQERLAAVGGGLTLRSAPGAGTRLVARVPASAGRDGP